LRKQYEHLWAIILAGGDGLRMREYLKTRRNIDRPKQFANIVGTHSMLRHTIERVKRIVSLQRMRIVVNIQHLKYVHAEIPEPERKSLIVLPCNRETAVGILLPVVQIFAQDPSACITVFPSDHFYTGRRTLYEFCGICCGLCPSQSRDSRTAWHSFKRC